MATIVEKTATHTPGPWEVSSMDGRTIQHESGHFACYDGNQRLGDRIPKYQGIATVLQRGTEETKANADLIAAAPDLLVALKKLSDMLMGDSIDSADIRSTDEFEAAQAAITKAERGPSHTC